MYSKVYNEYILREEILKQRVKSMFEADKVIKTQYIQGETEITPELQKRYAYQKRKLMQLNVKGE